MARSPSIDRVSGKLTRLVHDAGAARPPHAVRAAHGAARAQDPRRSPRTSAAASATRCRCIPATSARSSPRSTTGRPVKWMEDRSENLMSTGFARDYAMRGAIAATARGQDPRRPGRRDRRPRRVQRDRAADQVPGRVLPRLHRLLRHRGGALPGAPACTRTRRRAASPTRARSGSPRPSTWSSGWSTASRTSSEIDPAELRLANLICARAVPVSVEDRLGVRLRRLRAGAAQGARDRRLRRSCAASRPQNASAAS